MWFCVGSVSRTDLNPKHRNTEAEKHSGDVSISCLYCPLTSSAVHDCPQMSLNVLYCVSLLSLSLSCISCHFGPSGPFVDAVFLSPSMWRSLTLYLLWTLLVVNLTRHFLLVTDRHDGQCCDVSEETVWPQVHLPPRPVSNRKYLCVVHLPLRQRAGLNSEALSGFYFTPDVFSLFDLNKTVIQEERRTLEVKTQEATKESRFKMSAYLRQHPTVSVNSIKLTSNIKKASKCWRKSYYDK